MNLKTVHRGFRVWAGAQADIDRVLAIWRDCLDRYGGPFLFGRPSVADAMYAPVCTRFPTYDVRLDRLCEDYSTHILAWKPMAEWLATARSEPEEIEELEVDF